MGGEAELVKASALDAEVVGFKSQRDTQIFKNYFEYFSATLSNMQMNYGDYSRWFNRKIVTASKLWQVSLLRITLAAKARTKRWEWPLTPNFKKDFWNLWIEGNSQFLNVLAIGRKMLCNFLVREHLKTLCQIDIFPLSNIKLKTNEIYMWSM